MKCITVETLKSLYTKISMVLKPSLILLNRTNGVYIYNNVWSSIVDLPETKKGFELGTERVKSVYLQ